MLAERLNVFADVLLSRWKKRSQAKREALLKEAAPDLEEKQWILLLFLPTREGPGSRKKLKEEAPASPALVERGSIED